MPEEAILHQLISSLQVSLSSQAKTSFASVSFLKQKQWETLVSHLPTVTHASVKHTLLMSPSSSSLFSEDVIRESLTQVKEDSHLKLLENLSSSRGGKQTASSASSSGQRCVFPSASSSSSSSSAYAESSSRSSHDSEQPASPLSLSRGSKVAFKGILWSPQKKHYFCKWEPCPSPLRVGGCLSLHWTIWRGRGAEP